MISSKFYSHNSQITIKSVWTAGPNAEKLAERTRLRSQEIEEENRQLAEEQRVHNDLLILPTHEDTYRYVCIALSLSVCLSVCLSVSLCLSLSVSWSLCLSFSPCSSGTCHEKSFSSIFGQLQAGPALLSRPTTTAIWTCQGAM